VSPSLGAEELAALDEAIDRALASGDAGSLEVLGYGEISTVVAWPAAAGRLACKRLPAFESEARVAAYRACFDDYLAALGAGGVPVVPSTLQVRARPDGHWSVTCVQAALPVESLGPRLWAEAPAQRVIAMFDQILEQILGATGPRLGIDGQLSNWAWLDGEPWFLDVSTPLLRDADGRERLDTDLFIASLPWALRSAIRRFLLDDILAKYYEPRGVVLDLLGNLYKERLGALVPALLERANLRVERPFAADEPARYYSSDRRMWGLLQSVRRLDRSWQRGVRRRPYGFLLPGRIER
jgi:hypothetical protein